MRNSTKSAFLAYKLITTGMIFLFSAMTLMASCFSVVTGRTGNLGVSGCVLGAITGLLGMCFGGFIHREVRKGRA